VGWALHHQIGSSGNFARCSTANGWLVIAVGLVACLIIVTSGALSWTAWRRAAAKARAATKRRAVSCRRVADGGGAVPADSSGADDRRPDRSGVLAMRRLVLALGAAMIAFPALAHGVGPPHAEPAGASSLGSSRRWRWRRRLYGVGFVRLRARSGPGRPERDR
jgi:hypothetical protein